MVEIVVLRVGWHGLLFFVDDVLSLFKASEADWMPLVHQQSDACLGRRRYFRGAPSAATSAISREESSSISFHHESINRSERELVFQAQFQFVFEDASILSDELRDSLLCWKTPFCCPSMSLPLGTL